MKFFIDGRSAKSFKTDIMAIPCYEGHISKKGKRKQTPIEPNHYIGGLDEAIGGEISRQIALEKFKGERQTSLLLFTAGAIPARYILLVGMGPHKEVAANDFRELGASVAKRAKDIRAKSAAIALDENRKAEHDEPSKVRAITEGVILGSYNFDRYKTDDEDRPPKVQEISFLYSGRSASKMRSAIDEGVILATATCTARDLVNTPGIDATPKAMARAAKKLADREKISCKVLGESEIKKERMGCLIAVAKGSAEPPVFIELSYKPKRHAKTHVVIVGKGITFDSGGISLKPPRGMGDMKCDMAGAAVVIATMEAIAQLKPRVRVTALIPAAENLPSGKALKPGDVIKARNGKTIEIITTDAEGRLVLADALSYAVDLKPDVIIDLATLTGGALYCCGELYTMIMGNDQKLVDDIMQVSDTCGEYMWQLPLVEEYKKGYTTGIADLSNSGKSKAQTIMGGIFLREFVSDRKWVHLDIAASSWTDEELTTSPKGATGAMVRTMVKFINNL